MVKVAVVVAFVSPIKGSAMLDVAEKRGQIIRFLEEALALADEIEDGQLWSSQRGTSGVGK